MTMDSASVVAIEGVEPRVASLYLVLVHCLAKGEFCSTGRIATVYLFW